MQKMLKPLLLLTSVLCYEPQQHFQVGLETSGMRWETSGCVRNALHAKMDPMKFFVSPNFPMKFTEGASCTWRVRASKRHKIQIIWTEFWMDDCKSGNQLIVTDKLSKKKYGPYCGTKKPPKLTLGNEVEITMNKKRTPHPTAGRGVIFMVGYQAFEKGSAPPSKGGAGKPMLAYNPDARSNVGSAPVGKNPGKSSGGGKSSKGINGVNVRAGSSGLVSVGMYKVNAKTGTVTFQKPKVQIKSASPSGDIKTGPQGKNGSPGGMVNGKCMDPPGMGCNNENWGKGAQVSVI